ncbi:MAG: hypothetical protein LBL66_06460 [Clostridiales bacterium]|nr:hypothetical protein [Clostridiales bacterium]
MTGRFTIHNSQCTIEGYGRWKRVGRALLARGRNQIGMTEGVRGAFSCSVEIAASRFRAPRNDKRGVRAPRNKSNDKSGVCAPRNDPVFISLQV